MVNAAGQKAYLVGNAIGAVIEVVVDHSDGSLAFGVNGAPPQRVPDNWPRGFKEFEGQAKLPFKFQLGAQLRPWAYLRRSDDRLCFTRNYLV